MGPKCGFGKKTRTRSRSHKSTQVKPAVAVADALGLTLKSASVREVIGLRREEEDIDQ